MEISISEIRGAISGLLLKHSVFKLTIIDNAV
jgi:hypothetical protein